MKPADQQVCDYDVFLSFRGPDTRQGFADVLCYMMERAGIRVFMDDDVLAVGDKIETILQAIDKSQICVPIFSKTFAQSKWCLREVRRMAKLKKDVAPIFYEVTPDDVKLKTPTYVGFMMEHREIYRQKRVEKWEEALKVAAGFKGMQVLNKRYTNFCKKFVEKILSKLGPREKFEVGDVIGLDYQVQSVMDLLDLGSIGVRYVGIYGMGGIGKTTLAKLIYNICSADFDKCGFIYDVRESSERHGLGHLATKLQNSLDRYSKRVSDFPLQDSFRTKKVLIVLDDVDRPEQVETLAGRPNWFGPGSRIIVTSRDMDVLAKCRTLHKEDFRNYQVSILKDDHALQLFSRCAFRKDSPPGDFENLSTEAISTCGGLPLAVVVIGRLLVNKEKGVWEGVIAKSRSIPIKEVKERLKISYEKLDYNEQQIFLDIACFHVCMDKIKACYMWEACKLYPACGLAILQSLSLIQISDDNQIWMHDQLRDLGKDIVCAESIHPRKRSRVWENDDALRVILSKKRKINVQGLCLEYRSKPVELTKREFVSFDSLRFLWLDQVQLRGNLDLSLPELRWLSLRSCSTFEVCNLTLPKLVTLDLSESAVTGNWVGWSFLQSARELRMLNLSRCLKLKRTPHFPKNMILETLILRGCENLVTIHSSIGNIISLNHLDLTDCERLSGLPKEVWNLVKLNTLSVSRCLVLEKFPRVSIVKLNSLVELDLSFTSGISKLPESVGELVQLKRLNLKCSKVEKLPHSIGSLESLVFLDISCTSIEELPSSIGGLKKLEHLDTQECRGLRTIPESIGELVQLKQLNLRQSQVSQLPCSIGSLLSLVSLELSNTKVVELPSSIGGLVELKHLYMTQCRELKTLPESIGELKLLVNLDLYGSGISELPRSAGRLTNLEKLGLMGCMSLRALPHSLGGLKRLGDLQLSNTAITELPDSVGDLENVYYVELAEVSRLPSSINQMPRLDMLIMRNCSKLRELPELPVSLTILRIWSDSKQILEVDSLAILVNLKYLELHANVSGPPSVLSRLNKLKELALDCRNSGCPWQIPSSLMDLTLENVDSVTNLPCISNLKELESLTFRNWLENAVEFESLKLNELDYNSLSVRVERCSEEVVHQVCRLKNLSELTIEGCEFRMSQMLDVSALTNLSRMTLKKCEELVNIIGPGNLKCLEQLRIECCSSLKGIEEKRVSKLKGLTSFYVLDCPLLYESCNALRIFQGLHPDKKFPYFFCGTGKDFDTRIPKPFAP